MLTIHSPARANGYIKLYDVRQKLSAIKKHLRSTQSLDNQGVQFLVQLLHSDKCRQAVPTLKVMNDKFFNFVTTQLSYIPSDLKAKETNWLLLRMAQTDAFGWQLAITLLDDMATHKNDVVVEKVVSTSMTGLILHRTRKDIVNSFIAMMTQPQRRQLADTLQAAFAEHKDLQDYVLNGLVKYPQHKINIGFYRATLGALIAPGQGPSAQKLQDISARLGKAPQKLKTLFGTSQHQALSRAELQSKTSLSRVLQMSDKDFDTLMNTSPSATP
mgnify:CR=1 FL=1